MERQSIYIPSSNGWQTTRSSEGILDGWLWKDLLNVEISVMLIVQRMRKARPLWLLVQRHIMIKHWHIQVSERHLRETWTRRWRKTWWQRFCINGRMWVAAGLFIRPELLSGRMHGCLWSMMYAKMPGSCRCALEPAMTVRMKALKLCSVEPSSAQSTESHVELQIWT